MLNLMLHSLQPSHGGVNFILAQLYVGVNSASRSEMDVFPAQGDPPIQRTCPSAEMNGDGECMLSSSYQVSLVEEDTPKPVKAHRPIGRCARLDEWARIRSEGNFLFQEALSACFIGQRS